MNVGDISSKLNCNVDAADVVVNKKVKSLNPTTQKVKAAATDKLSKLGIGFAVAGLTTLLAGVVILNTAAMIVGAVFFVLGGVFTFFRQRSLSDEQVRNDEQLQVSGSSNVSQAVQTVPSKHQKEVQLAITTFANDLAERISETLEGKSYSISAVSIIAGLGMCLHAIKEENKVQFIEKLGLQGLSEAEVHQAISATLHNLALPKDFKNGSIEVVQGLARKTGFEVADSMTQLVKETYRADVIVSDNLQEEVNNWVTTKTHDKIPTILNDNLADVVLLNAMYLAFQWEQKFEMPSRGHWHIEGFTCPDGTKYDVSMMVQNGTFNIYRDEKFSMLEKPYVSPSGRKLSQLIFLPNDPGALRDLEKGLTAESISKYRQKAAKTNDVQLSMPKTKAEFELDVFDLLLAMGLPLDRVDFSILDADLKKVIHKTFVANDEKGTEAAAVTAVIFEKCIRQPEIFTIDHAYAYMVMDGDTELFRGRISDQSPLVVDEIAAGRSNSST